MAEVTNPSEGINSQAAFSDERGKLRLAARIAVEMTVLTGLTVAGVAGGVALGEYVAGTSLDQIPQFFRSSLPDSSKASIIAGISVPDVVRHSVGAVGGAVITAGSGLAGIARLSRR